MPLINDKATKPEDFEFLLVDWVDAHTSNGWNYMDEVIQTPSMIQTAGWLIAEDKNTITIAGSAGANSKDSFQVSGAMTIPKGTVKRIRYLKIGNTRKHL